MGHGIDIMHLLSYAKVTYTASGTLFLNDYGYDVGSLKRALNCTLITDGSFHENCLTLLVFSC